MRRGLLWVFGLVSLVSFAQNSTTPPVETETTLRVTSRAVLVDVLVTDKNGKPVKGLAQDAFSVTEQGKPQTISFFEEHKADEQPTAPVEMPKYPPNVFSNFSPFPMPPAVNVVLLDSLNTRMESQSFVHAQAVKFLKNTKPGARTAIFTMGLGFHFIQGFTDDPAVLAAALNNKKNNEVQQSPLLQTQFESNAEQNLLGIMSEPAGNGGTAAPAAMIAALSKFLNENQESRGFDRMFLTLENLQKLATFLDGFPGRKNVIWFAETVPGLGPAPGGGGVATNPRLDEEIRKTMSMLAAARVALYPVDARGVAANAIYTAENVLPRQNTPMQMNSSFDSSRRVEDEQRNADQNNMKMLGEATGGRAFTNTNGLGDVIGEITAISSDFYTLSYAPTNTKMDGRFRSIDVKVKGGYHLSFRKGYFAEEDALPGAGLTTRAAEVKKIAAQNVGHVDPLVAFMDLGMPPTQQILMKVKVSPLGAVETPGPDKGRTRYGIDFALDLKDLELTPEADGAHKGLLNLSILAYDRYATVVSRKDHLVALNIRPDVYEQFKSTGVQLHGEIAVPKGNLWLRLGVFDQNTHKVGTLEIPLAAVKAQEPASAAQ